MPNDSTPTDLPRTDDNTTNEDPTEHPPTQQDEQTPAQKRAQTQTKKKFEFVSNLMINLDMLIYIELCVLYYMDCSLFRLLLRILPQIVFLTPKPSFIPPSPLHRPYIGAIFGPNILCMLLHIFTARSEAGEAMRGYLHGGVIIDLVGQKGPTSKVHLLLLDLLVLVLQCFMLAVHIEKEQLHSVIAGFSSPATAGEQPQPAVVSTQDYDAEERGVIRDPVTITGDIELQPLPSRSEDPSTMAPPHEIDHDRIEERERLLAEPAAPHEVEDDSGLDTFWSGTVILADFHILHNLRRQWDDYGNATESAIQTVGFSAEFAAVTANRRLNAASARFQRNMEALTN